LRDTTGDRDRKTWNPSTKTVSPIAPYHPTKYFHVKARGKRMKIILRSNRHDQLGQTNMPKERKREKEKDSREKEAHKIKK